MDMEVGIARHDAIIIAYHEHCMYLARGGREPRGRVWLAREPRGRLLPRCIDSVDTPNAARTYAGDRRQAPGTMERGGVGSSLPSLRGDLTLMLLLSFPTPRDALVSWPWVKRFLFFLSVAIFCN